jgi:hypothetical protein
LRMVPRDTEAQRLHRRQIGDLGLHSSEHDAGAGVVACVHIG